MKQNFALFYLFTLIFIAALSVGLSFLFMDIVDSFAAFLISEGLVLTLSAFAFSNTRIVRYLEKLKK